MKSLANGCLRGIFCSIVAREKEGRWKGDGREKEGRRKGEAKKMYF